MFGGRLWLFLWSRRTKTPVGWHASVPPRFKSRSALVEAFGVRAPPVVRIMMLDGVILPAAHGTDVIGPRRTIPQIEDGAVMTARACVAVHGAITCHANMMADRSTRTLPRYRTRARIADNRRTNFAPDR
jgi:hypothetical protein